MRHNDGFMMSGNRFLLDTNAVVALLGGKSNLEEKLSDAAWIGVSVISVLEFLVFEGLSDADVQALEIFSVEWRPSMLAVTMMRLFSA